MKKLWWLLPVALLAAGSLVFMACPTGGGDSRGGDDDDDWEVTLEAGKTIELTRNGYGNGYQGFAPATLLGNSFKFKEGEEYTLKAKFTASRAVKDDDKNKKRIGIGLVDRSATAPAWSNTEWPESWKNGGDTNYWTKLANEGDDLEEGVYYTEDITAANQEFEVDATFTIIGTASAAGFDANAIFFQTEEVPPAEGTGTNNNDNSDDYGKLTLTVVEFTFTRVGGSVGPGPGPGGDDGVTGALGEPTYQKGTGDEDGKESQMAWVIDVDDLDGATIELVFGNAIAGGWQLILQSKAAADAGFGGWDSFSPTEDDGTVKDGFDYVTLSTDKKTITIDVDAWFDDEDLDFSDKDQVKFVFAYYSGDTKAHSLDIKSADLK